MTSSERYIANPDVSSREEESEGAILFNPDTDSVLVINITGLMVWEELSEPRSRDELVEILAERCNNVPRDRVAEDVSAFLNRLVEKGFAEIHKEST